MGSNEKQYKYMGAGVTIQPLDFSNKSERVTDYILRMLNITQSMFEYEGLPETLPQRNIEVMLQTGRHICITDKATPTKELYAFNGGMGGEPDPYYLPTLYVVANPALKFSASLVIGEDCVVIRNDSMYTGLLPLLEKYATLETEVDISLKLASINARIMSLISTDDDNAFKSAMEYLKNIEDGKLGVIGESAFLNGIKVNDFAKTNSTITQLIELKQYLRAIKFNDIGLNANYNMKRESINSNESQLNEDALLPFIEDMLKQRQEGFEEVNKKYGTNIKVKLSSSWKVKKEEFEKQPEETKEEVQKDEV